MSHSANSGYAAAWFVMADEWAPKLSWLDTRFVMFMFTSPADWETDVPGLPEIFYQSTTYGPLTKDVPDRDYKLWMTICNRYSSVLLPHWSSKITTAWKARWVVQGERTGDRYVFYMALELGTYNVGGSFYKQLSVIKSLLVEQIFHGITPRPSDWFGLVRNNPVGGGIKIFALCHILFMFLNASEENFLFGWSNIADLEGFSDKEQRKTLFNRCMGQQISSPKRAQKRGATPPPVLEPQPRTVLEPRPRVVLEPQPSTSASTSATTMSSNNTTSTAMDISADTFKHLVERLVSMGVTTEYEWALKDHTYYGDEMSVNFPDRLARKAMLAAKSYILANRSVFNYITGCGPQPTRQIYDNPVTKYFIHHGFDPVQLGSIILLWSTGCCKQTTLWFCGTEKTGTEALVAAMLDNVPLSGILSGRLSQSAIGNCFQKLLLWWRITKDSHKNKQIFSFLVKGSHFDVPHGRNFVTVKKTALILTGKEDMFNSCYSSVEAAELSSRVIKVPLEREVEINITPPDVARFLSWVASVTSEETWSSDVSYDEDKCLEVPTYDNDELNARLEMYTDLCADETS